MKILAGIGPDVIFEEIRPTDFETLYRDQSKHTLEMRTVGRYLKIKPARQVPVDDYAIPDSFARDMFSMDEYVESNSIEYCGLAGEIDQKTHLLGFRFLNSQEYEALNKRANEAYEKVIAMSGSQVLKNRLSMWNTQVRKREASMVENIYEFSRKSSLTEGVFLVGAAHLAPILENAGSRMRTEGNLADGITWNRLRLRSGASSNVVQ
jgi:hypothetical protein